MFAALKGTIIRAVLYGTQDAVYPEWLKKEVIDELFEDNTGTMKYRLTDETDDIFKWTTFEPYNTIVLRNKYGDIHTINLRRFERLYVEIGPWIAALKEDCVEYFKFTKDTRMEDVPEWVKSRIDSDGVIWMDHDAKWWCRPEIYGARMSPTCIFIRNKKGEIRYMEVEEFERCFDAPNNPQYYKYIYNKKED